MEYVIETQNLVKQFKTKLAVNDISIHVKRGDIYGLIGKNGAGKTSLMKLILGLTNPTQGKIFLFGNENLNMGRKKIGSLIEAPGLIKVVRLTRICCGLLRFTEQIQRKLSRFYSVWV